MDPVVLTRLIRKARKFDARSKDESITDEARASASLKRDALQDQILLHIHDPYAVKNAAIESAYRVKLLNRKTTNAKNLAKRERRAREADVAFNAALSEQNDAIERAKGMLDLFMGRVETQEEATQGT